ncbi:MAG: nucleotide exchange factor GrpE [Streptosporangiaceae bacterium]
MLAELAGRLDDVEQRLGEFHQRAAHREGIINRLHEENQRLHDGFGRMLLEPMVADLIRLYDQLEREAVRLKADGQDDRLMRSFAEDVAEILDRCGFEVFSAEVGDPFERGRHRPVELVACDDESAHNTVAEVVAVGFFDRDADRVRRPVHARFHQYAQSSEARPARSTAQSR